jgi:hypothetical protein
MPTKPKTGSDAAFLARYGFSVTADGELYELKISRCADWAGSYLAAHDATLSELCQAGTEAGWSESLIRHSIPLTGTACQPEPRQRTADVCAAWVTAYLTTYGQSTTAVIRQAGKGNGWSVAAIKRGLALSGAHYRRHGANETEWYLPSGARGAL